MQSVENVVFNGWFGVRSDASRYSWFIAKANLVIGGYIYNF
jgi:hypothetical protein